MNEITKNNGLGWQTFDRWKETQQILADQGVIKNPVDPNSLFSNKFLAGSPKM